MNSEPTNSEPVVAEAHPHELESLIEYVYANGKTLAATVLVTVAAVVGVLWYRASARKQVVAAAAKLGTVRTAQELEALVADYPSAPTTPVAVLRLAKALFDSGNYDAAMVKYTEFGLKHAGHPLADGADVGRIHCLEARGQVREAEAAFAAFAAAHPASYLAPQAVLGRGRCLEELGRLQDAKALYEEFVAANAGSEWAGRAEELLSRVKEKISELAGPTATSATIAIPPAATTPAN